MYFLYLGWSEIGTIAGAVSSPKKMNLYNINSYGNIVGYNDNDN